MPISHSELVYVYCPVCGESVCTGLTGDAKKILKKYPDAVSLCKPCDKWFKWSDSKKPS